ncbi:MAG: phytoene desaturase family protein [Bacillota bacterium]
MPNNKVIVIGAGLGGISSAIYLSLLGLDVHIIEKNNHIGGKLNELKKDEFTFDLGPSILTMPHIFEELFEIMDEDINKHLDLKKLNLQWRCFFEDKTVIDLYEDIDKMQGNKAVSDEDVENIKEFMNYSKDLYELTKKGYFDKGLDTFKEVRSFYGIKDLLFGFDYFSIMHKGVARYIDNPYLIDVYDYFIKYVGSSAYDAPAVLNILPYVQKAFGLWYIDGGLYNLARALEKLLSKANVKVTKNREVKEMVYKDGYISGVKLDNGEIIKGDIFVSNMEVIPVYRELLKENDDYLEEHDKFEPACSGLVLHIGVDREYAKLSHHNFFFSNNLKENFDTIFHKKELPEDPTIYLVATTRTDRAQAPEGCENIKILPHIPYIQDKKFSKDEYMALKLRVLEKLERMGLEDLRKHIIFEDIWLPEDIESSYKSNHGAIYGVVSDRKKNKGFKAPKHSDKYDNLFFVGGSVNPGGGMPMVTLSGKQVSEKIKEKYNL